MRQAGLKPKNHSSGVYWVRAASGNGTNEETKDEGMGIVGTIFFVVFLPLVVIAALIDRMSSGR